MAMTGLYATASYLAIQRKLEIGVAARYMQVFLYQVDARDPWTYVLVAVVLIVTRVGAAWLPAHRASHTDPAEALRVRW
jgi:ABC-type lipoprotein release transport system permease subunit